MPFFDAKDRTVMSPINPKLEPLYVFLEKYQQSLSGSRLFDDLLDAYDCSDQVLVNNDKIFHAWNCHSGCGHTTLMDKFLKGKRIYCANCGSKTEMVYLGETTLISDPVIPNKLTLGGKNNERITTG